MGKKKKEDGFGPIPLAVPAQRSVTDAVVRGSGPLLVQVLAASVHKLSKGLFKVEAVGQVPTSGWKVELNPYIYITPPSIWQFEAVGTPPNGIILPVVSIWRAEIVMYFAEETGKVGVIGSNGEVIAEIPHSIPIEVIDVYLQSISPESGDCHNCCAGCSHHPWPVRDRCQRLCEKNIKGCNCG